MSKYTIIRDEEYRRIAKFDFSGKVLDLGGNKKAGYHELMRGQTEIITANIDAKFDCDVVFDAEDKFPLSDKDFDNIICLNVLEHTYNFKNIISESFRVLKDGGFFVGSTPFIFQIHGSPDDYFRYTKSCITRFLRDAGFRDIKIEELGYGLFSAVFQLVGAGIKPVFLREAIKKIFISVDLLLLKTNRYKKIRERFPIGYFIVAKK
ncbi:MAG: methyltransferase domain-containing protein [Candidatus Buchananbacteria bacterium]